MSDYSDDYGYSDNDSAPDVPKQVLTKLPLPERNVENYDASPISTYRSDAPSVTEPVSQPKKLEYPSRPPKKKKEKSKSSISGKVDSNRSIRDDEGRHPARQRSSRRLSQRSRQKADRECRENNNLHGEAQAMKQKTKLLSRKRRRVPNALSPSSSKKLLNENERLRRELRLLTEELNDQIRKARMQARAKRTVKSANKQYAEVDAREIRNLHKQNDNYKKANEYLRKQVVKLSDGRENTSYSDMAYTLREKQEVIKKLKREIKLLQRNLNRPASPQKNEEYEMQMMTKFHRAQEETRIAKRKHQRDLDRIRELEKSNRTKHARLVELRDQNGALKKNLDFKGGSPKKLKTRLNHARKKMDNLEACLHNCTIKLENSDDQKKKLQKLTFRQNKELSSCRELIKIQRTDIKNLKKTLGKREALIRRKFKISKKKELSSESESESESDSEEIVKQKPATIKKPRASLTKTDFQHPTLIPKPPKITNQKSIEISKPKALDTKKEMNPLDTLKHETSRAPDEKQDINPLEALKLEASWPPNVKEINPLEALKEESLKFKEGKFLQPNSPKEISIEEKISQIKTSEKNKGEMVANKDSAAPSEQASEKINIKTYQETLDDQSTKSSEKPLDELIQDINEEYPDESDSLGIDDLDELDSAEI